MCAGTWCAHISKHGRMHARPSVCVKARRAPVHTRREMCAVIRRGAPSRGGGNWVTALCKLAFWIHTVHTRFQNRHSHTNTHTNNTCTLIPPLSLLFGRMNCAAAKFSPNVANVQLDYNWIHKGNNLSHKLSCDSSTKSLHGNLVSLN